VKVGRKYEVFIVANEVVADNYPRYFEKIIAGAANYRICEILNGILQSKGN
jgi:hypothetical protein